MKRVLLTDHPWEDVEIERGILEAAGMELVAAERGAAAERRRELAADVAAIMTCWAPVPRGLIEAPAALEIVARMGVGVDNIDLQAAAETGALVTNVPDYCFEEVSDHVVALVHAWARAIVFYDTDVREGRWRPGAAQLRRVRDLTIGVVGLGRIGRRTAEKFAALGCAIVTTGTVREPSLSPAIQPVDLPTLLERADVVTLHLPLTDDTRHMVNSRFLDQMKAGSLLVNTARGALVDTTALVKALSFHLGGAALDVWENEPAIPDELRALPNVLLTPHVAFSSTKSLTELRERATEEVVRVLTGQAPLHPVSRP